MLLRLPRSLTGEPDRLLRAVLAAAVVGAGWFAVAFLAPSAMGLGDVRVAALAAGLLGWTSWSAVLAGQLAAFGLAVVTAGILAVDPTPGAWPGDAGPDGTGAHRRRDPGDLAVDSARDRRG